MEAACPGRRIVLIPKASRASTAPRLRGFFVHQSGRLDSHLRMTPARRWLNLPACVADLVSTMPAARVSGCRGISLPCDPHQSAIASSPRTRAFMVPMPIHPPPAGAAIPSGAGPPRFLKESVHVPAKLVRPLGPDLRRQTPTLEVLHSAAGHYIGTRDIEGPVSRESAEYFRSSAAAQRALDRGGWTQLPTP